MTTLTEPVSKKTQFSTLLPSYVFHEDFSARNSSKLFDPLELLETAKNYDDSYMPDDVTREFTKRMHYAAHRMHTAKTFTIMKQWQEHYHRLRDSIVLGNRKLIYRAVRRRMFSQTRMDDLIGDCQIVLIQAVAAFNPWLGIRFSTYAYTCLVRALARISQRLSSDWLARSTSLENLSDGEPSQVFTPEPSSTGSLRLEEFLREDHPLLSRREKTIISRRFSFTDSPSSLTLEQVGAELGLSKERVRQVQALALDKLRKALGDAYIKA